MVLDLFKIEEKRREEICDYLSALPDTIDMLLSVWAYFKSKFGDDFKEITLSLPGDGDPIPLYAVARVDCKRDLRKQTLREINDCLDVEYSNCCLVCVDVIMPIED